jgi:hypothetical protein
MSGSRAKAARREAKKCITNELRATCEDFFNSMCMLPLGRRVKLAAKIVFKKGLKVTR